MIELNDPRLTAYALGELDADERQEIRAAIESSAELQQAVREIRDTAGVLETEFAAELQNGVATGKVSLADKTEPSQIPSSAKRGLAWIIAASLLVGVSGFWIWTMQPKGSGVALMGGMNVESPLQFSAEFGAGGPAGPQMLASEATSRQQSLAELNSELQKGQAESWRHALKASKAETTRGYTVLGESIGGDGTITPFPSNLGLTVENKKSVDESELNVPSVADWNSAKSKRSRYSPIRPSSTEGPELGDSINGISNEISNQLAPNGIVNVQIESPDGGTVLMGGIKRVSDGTAAGKLTLLVTPRIIIEEEEPDLNFSKIVDPSGTREIVVNEDYDAPDSQNSFFGVMGGVDVNGKRLRELEAKVAELKPNGNLSAEKTANNDEYQSAVIELQQLYKNRLKEQNDRNIVLQNEIRRGENSSGDRFEPIHENSFLRPGSDPLSTFSIDVDTASYSKVRSLLKEKRQLPPPDAVRIEELVNYFGYNYAPPTDDVPFAAHQSVAACPWNPKHKLVRVAIKGREIQQDKRPVSNLVFLLDVSGSMNEPNKLPLVKRGIQMLVENLSENDRVAMVVYAGAAGKVLDSTTGDKKPEILAALDRLQAGGSTNGGDGIRLAYQMALDNFITGGVNRVILCTDGDFNVGTTGNDDLVNLVEEKAKDDVFLSVLGYGNGNLNDSMLEQISNKGNGNYAFIDTESEARKVLVEQMSGTLVTIAKDVKIQVEFNPLRVGAYRLVGYENRVMAAEDFNNDMKDAGEIGAGHTVTAIYEIVSPEAWKAEQTVEIALAGLFDLNFDGVDDREQLTRQIEKSGGRVVAWNAGDGSIQGELTQSTRYIVLGDVPSGDSETDKKIALSVKELIGMAAKFNVARIETVRLLEWIGVSRDSAADKPVVDELKYRNKPDAKAVEDNGELLTLKLRYKQPDGDVSQLLTFPLMDSDQSFLSADPDFQFAASVASFGMLLRGSKHAGNATLDSVLETAQAATDGDESGYRAEFLEMVRIARELMRERTGR